MEKVAIFIDGSNFYHGLKAEIGKTKIDYKQLGVALTIGRALVRIYYYTAVLKQTDDLEKYKAQQRFLGALSKTPYLQIILGRLEKRQAQDGTYYVEKGVDVNIAVDLLKLAYTNVYDTAILISGDGDFATAVEAVKSLGKHVECAYFPKRKQYHLTKACDKFTPLDSQFLTSNKIII